MSRSQLFLDWGLLVLCRPFEGIHFFKNPHTFLQLKGYKQHFCVATFDIFFSAQIKGKLR